MEIYRRAITKEKKMIVQFFKHGTGKARSAINYLLGSTDHTGKQRSIKPILFDGDPKLTELLIDTNHRKFKYASGAISFKDDEKPSETQLKEIIKSFKKSFCPSMEDRINLLWVLHEDKNNIELHFLCPMVSIPKIGINKTMKQFNINPPGLYSQQLQKDFSALWNEKLGFEQVIEDPFKAQLSKLDWKVPGQSESKDFKKKISEKVSSDIRRGRIDNREALIVFLSENGYKVTKSLKTCVYVKAPFQDEAIRLRGPIFREDADYQALIKQVDEKVQAGRKLTPDKFTEVFARFNKGVEYRRNFNAKRFSDKKRVSKGYAQPVYKEPKNTIKTGKISLVDALPVQTTNNVQTDEITAVKQQSELTKEKTYGYMNGNQKRSSSSQDAINASPSGASSSMGSIERLNASISFLENSIHLLITKLAHAPVEKRTEIENQISQMKIELAKVQYALEEAKKASLNSDPNALVSKIHYKR